MSKLYVDEIRPKSSGKQVIMPEKPAFSYGLAGTVSNISTGWRDVEFDTKIFEVGNNFNTSTYSYIVPVSGIYQFNATVRTDNVDTAAGYYQFRFNANDYKEYWGLIDPNFSSDLSYLQFSGSMLFQLDEGDAVKVEMIQSSGTAQTDLIADARFSGFLVG